MRHQPGDHYVLGKLDRELLPWLIGGRRAARQHFVYIATVYGYGGEFATALAGVGIGTPVVALFQGKTTNGQDPLITLREALPGAWFLVGVAALVLWLILRLVVRQQNAVDRALFARDCEKTMKKLELELEDALAEPNPLPKIVPIQEARKRAVREAIDKNVWPWSPPLPGDKDIDDDLTNWIDQIRGKFMSGWAPPPEGVN